MRACQQFPTACVVNLSYCLVMRTTRLLAMMMDLSRASTTVPRLAARYGVSERTVQRDVAALAGMGVPVWTRTGPGGGVGLVDGWRSPLAGMTAAELQALVVGEAGSRDLGLLDALTTARLKMLTAAPAQAAAARAVHERFLLDNERWFVEPGYPAALPAVARAVWAGRRITVEYARPGRERARRLLDPLGLVLKTDVWYLVAAHRRRLRTYRLSRILTVHMHDDDAWRPADFDLPDYWDRARRDFEASLATLAVRLRIPADAADSLLAAVPGPHTAPALAAARTSGDRIEVELRMENDEIAAAQLLAVAGVEVIEPASLRASLYRRGRELTAGNRPAARAGRDATAKR